MNEYILFIILTKLNIHHAILGESWHRSHNQRVVRDSNRPENINGGEVSKIDS